MRPLLLALFLLLAQTPLEAQQRPNLGAIPPSALDSLKDGHVGYNSGFITDMPQGTDKLYMTLVTSDDWYTDKNARGEAQRKLKAWLENDPRLIRYRKDSHFNWYTASDPLFTGARTLANGEASSLKKRLGEAYPILAIEKSSGEALFKMSALSLAGSSGELADWITSSLKAKSEGPPKFVRQSEATPVLTEGIEQCPSPDNCPYPNNTPPSDSSDVLPDSPKPLVGDFFASIVVLGLCSLIAVCVIGAAAVGVRK